MGLKRRMVNLALVANGNRPLEVFMCSVLRGQGFRWFRGSRNFYKKTDIRGLGDTFSLFGP